jgi:cytosine/adenosine deaminase-related metal-dependent hydrolase
MLQTLREQDHRRWLDAASGLEMATGGGARLMGLQDRLGKLEAGRAADFLLFDLRHTAFVPLNDPTRQLVFANAAGALRSAYVDGRAVLDEDRMAMIDEDAVQREIESRIDHLQGMLLAGVPVAQQWEPHLVRAFGRGMAAFNKAGGPRCSCCGH